MTTVLVYQCTTCLLGYTEKRSAQNHLVNDKHNKLVVVKLPEKTWLELTKGESK